MLVLSQSLRQALFVVLIYNHPIHFYISHWMAHSERVQWTRCRCWSPLNSLVKALMWWYLEADLCGVIRFGSVMRGDTLMISATSTRYVDRHVHVPSPLSPPFVPSRPVMWYSEKVADRKARGLSPGSDNVRTSTVGLQPPRTVTHKYVIFKPPSMVFCHISLK